VASLARRLARDLQLAPGPAGKLAASFFHTTQEDLQSLASAAQAGDAKRVAFLAHHVKGAAAFLGIEAIRALAESLERRAAAGDLQSASGLLAGIGAELRRLESER